jgi:hypothetical protein
VGELRQTLAAFEATLAETRAEVETATAACESQRQLAKTEQQSQADELVAAADEARKLAQSEHDRQAHDMANSMEFVQQETVRASSERDNAQTVLAGRSVSV